MLKKKSSNKLSLKERLANKRAEIASRGGGGNIHLIKEGTTRIRLLPVGEEKEFAVETTQFYLGEKLKSAISPVTIGQPCAIMEAYNSLSSSKDVDDREMAKKFKPGKKYYAPAIVYKDEKGREVDTEAGVRMVVLAGGLYNQIIDLYLDVDEAGDMTDKETGYDLKIKRTGKGKNDTEYTLIKCNPTPLKKPFNKKVYDPEEMMKELVPSYKETKQKIEEYLSLDPDEDADEVPKKKKTSSSTGIKKKKKRRDL